MRINKFVAQASGLSRRGADQAIIKKRITLDGRAAQLGDTVAKGMVVKLDGRLLELPQDSTVLMLNKPVGYVSSRDGQGSPTIYDLLPPKWHLLKIVGRLDKDSSGLLLITNDGDLANKLTHPRYTKPKVYEVELNKPLEAGDRAKIERGVELDTYTSRLGLKPIPEEAADGHSWQVSMTQGRNRQIRRTFEALGYTVTKLHRAKFGDYTLNNLPVGTFVVLP